MTILMLVLAAALLTALSLLCWSRCRQQQEQPYGTGLQRAASLALALAFLSAGFADRAYRQQTPDSIVIGTIIKVTPKHTKYDFRRTHGSIEIALNQGSPLSLDVSNNINSLHPGETVRIAYDQSAMLVRTVDILVPPSQSLCLNSIQSLCRIDNRAINRRQLNAWMWAAIFLAYTALPLKWSRDSPAPRRIASFDRSNSQYGAGG